MRGLFLLLSGSVLVAAGLFPGTARAALQPIHPQPKLVRPLAGNVRIASDVTVVAGATADPAALGVVRRALRASGAVAFHRVLPSRRRPPAGLVVYIAAGAPARSAVGAGAAPRRGEGSYLLVVRPTARGGAILLDGVDAAGQFYAAQSLRQLLSGRSGVPAVSIRDWPSFSRRGVVEGFYGKPWTAQERLSMLDYLGAHKLNTYVYMPKDEPFLRASWRRRPGSPTVSKSLSTLVRRAALDHVTLSVGVSPGDSICYTSPVDQQALIDKLSALWELGIRSFVLAFDDVDTARIRCESADTVSPSSDASLALDQVALANRVDSGFIATHPGAAPLIVVPTEYNGLASTAYQQALARNLRADVLVQWTGIYGTSLTVSTADAASARALYGHPLLLWDNEFVTDYSPGYLVLGGLDAFDSALAGVVAGVTVDPMVQAESSKISLFTAADYLWSPATFDPAASWRASLWEFANGDQASVDALHALADACYSSPVDPQQAPELSAAIAAFWKAWNTTGDVSAAPALRARLVRLEQAPGVIRSRLENRAFIAEASPWLDSAQIWAASAIAGLDLLVSRRMNLPAKAVTDEQTARALRTKAQAIFVPDLPGPVTVRVAQGVLDLFVHEALRGYGP